MAALRYILMSLFIICGIVLIATIMLQEGKSAGLGSLGGMSSADTYWEKNKGRSKEGLLQKVTTIAAVAFFVLGIVLAINF